MQVVRVLVFVSLLMALVPFGLVRAQQPHPFVALAPFETVQAQEPDPCLGQSPDAWRQQKTELQREIERLDSNPQGPDAVVERYGMSKTKAEWLQTYRNLLASTMACLGAQPEEKPDAGKKGAAQAEGAGPLEFVEHEDGVCVLRAPFVCISLDGRTYTRPDAGGKAPVGQGDVAEQQPADGETGERQAGAKARFNGEWAGNLTGTWWNDKCRAPVTGNVTLKLRQDEDGGPVVASLALEISTPGRRCGRDQVGPSTQKTGGEYPGTTPSGDNLQLSESTTVTLLPDGSLKFSFSTPPNERYGIDSSSTARRR